MKVKSHIINISNCTLHIVKVFIGFDTLFWPIFVDFQNETAGLSVNNFNGIIITLLFIIPRTLLLSSIQPEAETLDFLTHALPRNL